MDNLKSAIILAGGKSSRMEFDKQNLIINNTRLIYEIAKNLENHFEEIIIVSNKKQYYENSKYKVISDEIKDMGPLAGISIGLFESSSEFVYVVACDMPNIDKHYINYLKKKIQKDIKEKKECDIYIANINNRIELFHGFYKKNIYKEINNYIFNSNTKSIKSFFERTNKNVNYTNDIDFNKEKINKNIFVNLNTKEDLKNYEKEILTYG